MSDTKKTSDKQPTDKPPSSPAAIAASNVTTGTIPSQETPVRLKGENSIAKSDNSEETKVITNGTPRTKRSTDRAATESQPGTSSPCADKICVEQVQLKTSEGVNADSDETSPIGTDTIIGGTNGDGSITTNARSKGKKDGHARNSRSCCFCWCCCCSCSCLSVKNNSRGSRENKTSQQQQQQQQLTSLDHYFNGDGEAPTLEEIRTWGESFDKLMKCASGRKVFRDFLKCEYSEENILFWLACEDLKKESRPDIIEEKARLIYEDYISILSPKEVSLDSRVREIVNRNMVEPTSHTFDEAQLQIYTLMHRDSYPRFVNSPVYRKLAQLPSPSRKGSMA
ncbi:regulator of G-protein signaling 17-like isoform X1 [Centruroides sculpturatus]|uniref:regulator of G-protein signaling 17-like isoform X1 n=1 Tax=Centruroides sculpturatus TaxID=218467 RepID=UPI000C6E2688|nr:regulator of G-protein signaling 17-like isoform X1 [Centruroides sculpturatus]XP_023216188.1 regulator of G-protein signaling 17-like isoform X1 [Centruroides sculpturatus]